MTDQVTTPTTRTDAVLRIVEDVVVVGGTAITTWLTTHNAESTAIAVTGAPIVRSVLAQGLSNRRVSGLLAALKLVYGALGQSNGSASTQQAPAAAPPAAATTAIEKLVSAASNGGTVTIQADGGLSATSVLDLSGSDDDADVVTDPPAYPADDAATGTHSTGGDAAVDLSGRTATAAPAAAAIDPSATSTGA